jgi:hypothetical protein
MELGDVGQPMEGDGASEMASEDEMKLDGVGTTTNEGDDEDLTCDWRWVAGLWAARRALAC